MRKNDLLFKIIFICAGAFILVSYSPNIKNEFSQKDIYLSDILGSSRETLPLSDLKDQSGWYLYHFSSQESVILSRGVNKNTDTAIGTNGLWKEVLLNQGKETKFRITNFETICGDPIDKFVSKDISAEKERCRVANSERTFVTSQAPSLNIIINGGRVRFESDFTLAFSAPTVKPIQGKWFNLAPEGNTTFYLFKIDPGGNFSFVDYENRKQEFLPLGKDVYKVTIEYLPASVVSVRASYFQKIEENQNFFADNKKRWHATIMSISTSQPNGQMPTAVMEDLFLPSEQIQFMAVDEVEGKTFFEEMLQQEIITLDGQGNKYPLQIISKDEVTCAENEQSCLEQAILTPANITSKPLLADKMKSVSNKALGKEIVKQLKMINNRTIFSSILIPESFAVGEFKNSKSLGVRAFAIFDKSGAGGGEVDIEVPLIRDAIPVNLLQDFVADRPMVYLRPAFEFLNRKPKRIRYDLPLLSNEMFPINTTSMVITVAGASDTGELLIRPEIIKQSATPQSIEVQPYDCGATVCSVFKYEDKLAIALHGTAAPTWYPNVLGQPYTFPKQYAQEKRSPEVLSPVRNVYAVEGSDNIPLLEKHSQNGTYGITQVAKDVGLFNLLGGNEKWSYHLAAVTKYFPNDIVLSIKLPIQRMVNQQVQKAVEERLSGDKDFKERTGTGSKITFVVMEADTGKILAASTRFGNYLVDSGLGYNLKAEFNPAHSIYRWFPGFHNQLSGEVPGSTFKLFVSLKLFDHIDKKLPHSTEITNIINGLHENKLNRAGSKFGFNYKRKGKFYPVSNGKKSYKVTEDCNKGSLDHKYSLKEALQFSDNCWFAWMLEATSPIMQYKGGLEVNGLFSLNTNDEIYRKALHPIEETIGRLGFATPIDLLRPGRNIKGLQPNDMASEYNSWLVRPVWFDATPDVGQLRRLAFGYKVVLTPMHLVTLSAMIAENKIISPTLLNTLQKDTFNDDLTMPQYIDLLRAGMKQVVTHGTLKASLNKTLHPRVWAKTGTAVTSSRNATNEKRNLWLTGYFCGNPQNNPPTQQNCNKKIAFVCNVSGAGKGTGASACGPLLEKIIKEGDVQHLWEQ